LTEEIFPGLFRIRVPLPKNPLKAINSYVIKSTDRNLIVDTGLNQEECLAAMQEGLKALGVDIDKTDFFITHLHADHVGLLGALAGEKNRIYCGDPDAFVVRSGVDWGQFLDFARQNGIPETEVQAASSLPGYDYGAGSGLNVISVKEGDLINAGEYSFRCVHTPGHTEGHMCLYDEDKQIILAGDHLLAEITPNISLWGGNDQDPIRDYFNSLDKVAQMEIQCVLPGHRDPFSNYRQRVDELKAHHRERFQEIMEILKPGSATAYQVASLMHWDMSYDRWEQFPVAQKWFATAEANAHLKYLEQEGLLKVEVKDGKIIYQAKI